MFKISELESEIEAKITQLEDSFPDQDIEADWIANAIMADHALAASADPDGFHHTCSFRTVREYTRRVVNRYEGTPSAEPDKQIVMAGFERLQTHYLVHRGGIQKIVRVDRLSSAERCAKASELRAMGAGCYQHADELDRYDAQAQSAA